MKDNIMIPTLEGMIPDFMEKRPYDHFTRDMELETQRRYQNLSVEKWVIEEEPRSRTVEIGVRILESIHEDRVKNSIKSSFASTSVPVGIRSAILCRMFGKDGEDAPKWWPEWLRERVKPRMKEIMTHYRSSTTICHQRVCPHKGTQGHGSFLFGPELAFSSRSLKNDLHRAAEKSEGRDFMIKVYELINACRKNGHQPTMISLGRQERHALVSSERFPYIDFDNLNDEVGETKEIAGLRIEEINRDTYLSIS